MNESMIMIQDKADRRQVAAILTDNGYTVKPVKVKIGKIKRIALAFCKEDSGAGEGIYIPGRRAASAGSSL